MDRGSEETRIEQAPPLEQLRNPPIVEVVCGVEFNPTTVLTPVALGKYWRTRFEEFPKHEVRPAISDSYNAAAPAFFFGQGPMSVRTWFVSRDEDLILQFQADRFYLNWRARNSVYPRFSDHGDTTGILSRFMLEYSRVQSYAKEDGGEEINARAIELTKLDHFVQGEHWSDLRDLTKLLPATAPMHEAGRNGNNEPSFVIRFHDRSPNDTLTVSLETILAESPARGPLRIVKLETRLVAAVQGDVASTFRSANERVNSVFARFIPESERRERFSTQEAQ